jgi:transcriptional regulator with XRE-family HTH domain
MVIGEQISRLRHLRRFTQDELAAASGVSVDVIRRLEQGQRNTARLATLSAIATALGAQLSVILAPQQTLLPPPQHGIDTIRRALTAPSLAGLTDLAETVEPGDVDLDQLAASTETAWTLWQRGEYHALGGLLPTLIAECRNAAREHMGDAQTRAWALLTTAYEVAAGVVVILGYEDLAWLAAERALDAAGRCGDPVALASAEHWTSWILRRQGRYAESQTVATRAAERHEPSLMRATADQLTVWGGLLVNAAGAASRAEHTDTADDLLTVAEGAASRLAGNRAGRWSVFGPRTVAQTRVVNAVEAGDFDTAVRLAARVDHVGGQVPATWEARYQLALAQAHHESGADHDTISALTTATRLAGEWVRYHRLARDLTTDLIGRVPPQRNQHLDALVRHLQLAA